jgi:hypothetical protein
MTSTRDGRPCATRRTAARSPESATRKARQLGTDLNRRVRDELQTSALDTVRRIAVNDVWSALRLRSTDD